MPQNISELNEMFRKREKRILDMIMESGISYLEIGVFGSYARGEYTEKSDIDFCVIVEEHPDRRVSGLLRSEADELGADIVYVRPEYFHQDESRFARDLRRDYRCLIHGQAK